jgi:hypothetical protein
VTLAGWLETGEKQARHKNLMPGAYIFRPVPDPKEAGTNS